MEDITSRIIKGGALLEESRRFVETWDDKATSAENLTIFRSRNLLAKRSRARAEDVIAILRQRFVEPGPEAIRALRALMLHADAFRDACYFEAARNDRLLAHVAGTTLFGLAGRGWVKVSVMDVERALLERPPSTVVTSWSEATRRRVVHGLLSALRDFGVLEGSANKHIPPPRITFSGFVYVLGRLRQTATSSHEIVAHPCWRWWLLDGRQVRGYLLEADRERILSFADAGSTLRIDWHTDGLEEMVRVAA
jgi:hypothetical protein